MPHEREAFARYQRFVRSAISLFQDFFVSSLASVRQTGMPNCFCNSPDGVQCVSYHFRNEPVSRMRDASSGECILLK